MNQSLGRSRRQGFTLIELLVVISIIAILASVITISAGKVIAAAKRGKAGVACGQIVTAIDNYYTDYNVYPVEAGFAGGTDEPFKNQGDWQNMTIALCGNLNPYTSTTATSTIPNSRATPYLTVAHSDVDVTGALKTPFPAAVGGGPQYYYAEVDSNYDNIIGGDGNIPNFSTATSSSMTFDAKLTVGAAAWSNCDDNATNPTAPTHWARTY